MRRALAICLVGCMLVAAACGTGLGTSLTTSPPTSPPTNKLTPTADTYITQGDNDAKGTLREAKISVNQFPPSHFVARYDIPSDACVSSARHVIRFKVDTATKTLAERSRRSEQLAIPPEKAYPAVNEHTLFALTAVKWEEESAVWRDFVDAKSTDPFDAKWFEVDAAKKVFAHEIPPSELNTPAEQQVITKSFSIVLSVKNNTGGVGTLFLYTKEAGALDGIRYPYLDLTYNTCTSDQTCNVATGACQDTTPPLTCENGGTTLGSGSEATCMCAPGYVGTHCEIVLDFCGDTYCTENQKCAKVNGMDKCVCSNEDHLMPDCTTGPVECGTARCFYGTCTSGTCDCDPGYTGKECSIDIDECETVSCQNDGRCIDGINSFTCKCPNDRVTGLYCEITECNTQRLCPNTRVCKNVNGRDKCVCEDPMATIQSNCRTRAVKCGDSHCYNGKCDVEGNCICLAGWTGVDCNTDINECALPHNCTNGVCLDDYARIACECNNGFNGTLCENDLCEYCENESTCIRMKNAVECDCPPRYVGDFCEKDLCEYCENGSTCIHMTKTVKCHCPPGYAGDFCEKDMCDDCQNGATCERSDGNVTCQCPPEVVNGTAFNSTSAGSMATGNCTLGYYYTGSRPSRNCSANAEWSAIQSPCQVETCPKIELDSVAYEATNALENAIGVCVSGFESVGSEPTAYCNASGVWEQMSTCTRVNCANVTEKDGTVWPASQYGEKVIGKCGEGKAGSPIRLCEATGELGDIITGKCAEAEVMCEGDGKWGNTAAGDTAQRTCPSGSFGVKQRPCSASGEWLPVVDKCKEDPKPVNEVTIVQRTKDSVTLKWTKAAHADMYDVQLLNGTFHTSRDPQHNLNDKVGSGNAEQTEFTAVVGGLNPYTDYNARVVAVATIDGIAKTAIPATFFKFQTELPYPTDVRVERGSVDYEIVLTWAPAPSASLYGVRHWRESSKATRAGPPTGQLTVFNGDPPVTITLSKSSEPVYVKVYSGIDHNGVQTWESHGSEVYIVEPSVFSPPADGIQNNAPEQDDSWRVIAIAAGVAGGIVLIVLAVALIVVRRRRRRHDNNKDMELDLMSMTAAPSSMSMGRDTMRHQSHASSSMMRVSDPPPYRSPEVTLLNTTSELAVPGFFIIDPATAFRSEGLMSSGGGGSIELVTLMDAEMIERNMGLTTAAAKTVPFEGDNQQDTETKKRLFEQEIMALWSLQSCPNVINLLGFSRAPQMVMVLELADMDLAKYLHQTPSTAKDPRTILQLASDAANGLAAVHKLGLIHRDIKAQNILVFNPFDASSRVAKLCDFGLVRLDAATAGRSTVRDFVNIGGLSPRYAAPEVFARTLLGTDGTAEDDRKADVYALGVVFWELVALQMPWEGYGKDDIMDMVKQGVRPPVPDLTVRKLPSEQLKLLNGLLNVSALCQQDDPAARPSVETVASSLLTVRSKI